MCEHCGLYQYFPSVIIGGPTGDYFIDAPVHSCRWMEYRVIGIANSTVSDAFIVISGANKPKALPYDGSVTLTDDQFVRGEAYFAKFEDHVSGAKEWERITNDQHRVYVRIDGTNLSSTYITIQFRARMLTIVPGQAETVHPDLGHQLNIARSERIKSHSKKVAQRAGIPESEWNNGTK